MSQAISPRLDPSVSHWRGLDGALLFLIPALLLCLWIMAGWFGWMSEQVLPPPSLVWETLLDYGREELWWHFAISLQRLVVGVLLGTCIGVLLGAVLGSNLRLERLFYPTFAALAQIPTLAWLPLFMVLVGIGEELKLLVLAKAVVVPVTVHTLTGVRDTQVRLQEVATALRLPLRLRITRLIIPSALPSFMAGLCIAVSSAWSSLLAVELLASSEGIGYLMVWGRQLFMLDIVVMGIIVIGLVGILIDKGVAAINEAVVFWPHPPISQLQRRTAPDHALARLEPILMPAALLLLWQLSIGLHWVNPQILVSPWTVLLTTSAGMLDGSLISAMALSLGRAACGLVVGGSLGFAVGLLLGLWPLGDRMASPTLSVLRHVAIFAWVPLITAWFGLGEPAKIVFISFATFFPMLIATQRGVAGLSPQLKEATLVLGLSRWQRLKSFVLPGAAPAIFAGLRLALIYAWLGTVGAEYFMTSEGGIGSAMIAAQQMFRMDLIMAGMLLIGLTGAALNNAGQLIEARATRWRVA